MIHRFPNFFESYFSTEKNNQVDANPAKATPEFTSKPLEIHQHEVRPEPQEHSAEISAETLAVIREAANRQWRRLQATGIETSKLMKLAATLIQSQNFSAVDGSEVDGGEMDDFSVEATVGDDQIWFYDQLPLSDQVENHPQVRDKAVSRGGTINLNFGKSEPFIVSVEGFFKFSFDFSEALNDLVAEVKFHESKRTNSNETY